MRTGLWFVVVDIFEPSVGYSYPVVRHVFPGKTEEEARGYFEAHMTTDAFMRDCVREGRWSDIKCTPSMVVLPPLVPLGRHRDQLPGGLADDMDPADFDPIALHEGTIHEIEHTKDPLIAREIAMDHLAEDPGYYIKRR